MMSENQKKELQILLDEFKNNVVKYEDWDSQEICNFSVYELEDEVNGVSEYRLVVGMVTIANINENYAGVNTDKRYYAIFPDGTKLDLLSSFKNDKNKVYDYLKKLNKIM